ncbi:MAG: class I tRNA ligase family protein [Anaerolineae bacterium]|nr:class I tRNA ligase family protein [Anaerolineae bacterium]
MFTDLTPEASFTRIEEEVRRFWRHRDVSEVARRARASRSSYAIYQEPLGVVGHAWPDQARLLATVDLLARHRAMQDATPYHRLAWSGHGLSIEVSVEKALGPRVEGLDLARFNDICRQAAVEGVAEGQALADRLGLWYDPASAYASFAPQAVGAVWGALRTLWDANLLRQERRVVSFCPRCATPLSAAEAARQAVEATAQSVWLILPWQGEANTYFLTRTLRPWTLAGMVGLAAHPETSYALVELPTQDETPPLRLVLAEAALGRTLMREHRLVRRLVGKSLRGARYNPPFTFLPVGKESAGIVLSEKVPLDTGTGLFPITPSFEALSLVLAQEHGLAVPDLLDSWGSFDESVTPWRGLSPLDADPLLVDDLRSRGLVYRLETGTAFRSQCPYCQTRLLPVARDVWLIETGSGPWVLSRDRSWSTPLPMWTCSTCNQVYCVAGLDDLAHRTGVDIARLDVHRPAVDRLTFPCRRCGKTMRRVPEVVDAAFESAVLPWALGPTPHIDEVQSLAIGLGDRDLGWLGDAAELAALLRGALVWEQAVTLPEIGVQEGWDPERSQPADALRWAAYVGSTPVEAERDFLRPLWRWVAGQEARQDEGTGRGRREIAVAALLDRWLQARLYEASHAVVTALDGAQPGEAAGLVAALVQDLVGWYTLHRQGTSPQQSQILEALSRLLAPFVPHLAEAMHRRLKGPMAESVHLGAGPALDAAWGDRTLLEGVALVRRAEALGLAARHESGLPARQSLARALVGFYPPRQGDGSRFSPLQELLTQVLGVMRLEIIPELGEGLPWRLGLAPGREMGRDISRGEVEAALASLEPERATDLAHQLWEGLSVSVEVGDQAVTLLPDEVSITPQAPAGWAAQADGTLLVLVQVG